MDYYKYGVVMSAVSQLVATVLILAFLGNKLDSLIGTQGIFLFLGGIAGGIVGLKRMMSQIKSLEGRDKK